MKTVWIVSHIVDDGPGCIVEVCGTKELARVRALTYIVEEMGTLGEMSNFFEDSCSLKWEFNDVYNEILAKEYNIKN